VVLLLLLLLLLLPMLLLLLLPMPPLRLLQLLLVRRMLEILLLWLLEMVLLWLPMVCRPRIHRRRGTIGPHAPKRRDTVLSCEATEQLAATVLGDARAASRQLCKHPEIELHNNRKGRGHGCPHVSRHVCTLRRDSVFSHMNTVPVEITVESSSFPSSNFRRTPAALRLIIWD
jgi:hypothetical protein